MEPGFGGRVRGRLVNALGSPPFIEGLLTLASFNGFNPDSIARIGTPDPLIKSQRFFPDEVAEFVGRRVGIVPITKVFGSRSKP